MVQQYNVLQHVWLPTWVKDSLRGGGGGGTKEDSLQLPHSGIRAKYLADCDGRDSRPVFMALGNPFHDLQKKAVCPVTVSTSYFSFFLPTLTESEW